MLTRADIEWLLAVHESENMRGPVVLGFLGHERRQGLDLRGAILKNEDLSELPLARVRFGMASQEWRAHILKEHIFAAAHVENVNFMRTDLREAGLIRLYCQGADFGEAHLERANLIGAHFEGAYLGRAYFAGCNFFQVTMSSSTILESPNFGDGTPEGGLILADVDWGGAALDHINWRLMPQLGDDHIALHWKTEDYIKEFGRSLTPDQVHEQKTLRLEAAARANRQVTIALRNQGIYEASDIYAYHAQALQRRIFWQQQEWGRWLFSKILASIVGYGYKLNRLLFTYILSLLAFALAYYSVSWSIGTHLTLSESLLVSFTAIHGRVFIGQFGLDSPLSWIAGIEAVFGVVVEGAFVALLLQRLFGR